MGVNVEEQMAACSGPALFDPALEKTGTVSAHPVSPWRGVQEACGHTLRGRHPEKRVNNEIVFQTRFIILL